MGNIIPWTHYNSTDELYFMVKNASLSYYNGATYEALNVVNIDDYAIDFNLVQPNSKEYFGVFPALAAGHYIVEARIKVGIVKSFTDDLPIFGIDDWSWNGTNRITDYELSINTAESTGARTITITVTDGTIPLESALIRLIKGSEKPLKLTDVDGEATFNIDDGTWIVAITLPGYTFNGATLVVTDNDAVTYEMDLIVISPSPAGQVTGYLTAYDEDGNVEEDVKFDIWIDSPSGSGIGYDARHQKSISNGSGLVQFTGLFKEIPYKLRRGTGEPIDITIPSTASGTYELNSVLGTP